MICARLTQALRWSPSLLLFYMQMFWDCLYGRGHNKWIIVCRSAIFPPVLIGENKSQPLSVLPVICSDSRDHFAVLYTLCTAFAVVWVKALTLVSKISFPLCIYSTLQCALIPMAETKTVPILLLLVPLIMTCEGYLCHTPAGT
jgi:hypothetical protein